MVPPLPLLCVVCLIPKGGLVDFTKTRILKLLFAIRVRFFPFFFLFLLFFCFTTQPGEDGRIVFFFVTCLGTSSKSERYLAMSCPNSYLCDSVHDVHECATVFFVCQRRDRIFLKHKEKEKFDVRIKYDNNKERGHSVLTLRPILDVYRFKLYLIKK